jgi:hypothetical protein
MMIRARDALAPHRHPPKYDGKNKWWRSPRTDHGLDQLAQLCAMSETACVRNARLYSHSPPPLELGVTHDAILRIFRRSSTDLPSAAERIVTTTRTGTAHRAIAIARE